jgi:LysR family transcriptional regulator, glycine cleavage system transcriptional activator
MYTTMPPLNALRAFEAAARHLSLTKAAQELNVTAGALSHQIRGLEELLGLKLFERRVRSIALTTAGRQLYPGLQAGFVHIRDAVAGLRDAGDARVLVISTPPGFTSKWLAPRLYRFSNANPEIDVRVSSTLSNANFTTDGVDVAVRSLAIDAVPDPELVVETLIEMCFVPVCSPRLIDTHGPIATAEALGRLPLIHDDALASRAKVPTWADWFKAAGVDGVDVSRGLRFNSPDHALDATAEGGGVLLAHDVLAYDDLRTGRLAIPFDLALRSGRAYCVVCAKRRQDHPNVQAFRRWIKQEVAALAWGKWGPKARTGPPASERRPADRRTKGARSR